MIKKMSHFEQLLIEIEICYNSATELTQHQSDNQNLGFKRGRIFFVFDMIFSSYMEPGIQEWTR